MLFEIILLAIGASSTGVVGKCRRTYGRNGAKVSFYPSFKTYLESNVHDYQFTALSYQYSTVK